MKIYLLLLFIQITLLSVQADSIKAYSINCDKEKRMITILPIIIEEDSWNIWKHDKGRNKFGQYELNHEYLKELKESDILIPDFPNISCSINENEFRLTGRIESRLKGRCSYDPDGYISISLNKKLLLGNVSFNEGCMSCASLTKLVLFLEEEPKLEICIKDNPHNGIEVCHLLDINTQSFITLTQKHIEDLSKNKKIVTY